MDANWPEGVAVRYHTAGGHIVDVTDDGRIGCVTVDDERSSTVDDYAEQLADRILKALAK